jgi:uridine phosphorylase
VDEMDVRFTPKMYVDYYAAKQGITVEEMNVAPIVVVSWAPSVIESFAESTGAQLAEYWPWVKRHIFYTGEVEGRRVSFVQVGIGAPATVSEMEVMIACGARVFVGLGWAGSLQPEAPVGTFLIPRICMREEGTSAHYRSDDKDILPDEGLVQKLKDAARAEGFKVFVRPHWTTDAPYRELCSTIELYKARGIMGVDMETSAMYALGQFRGVQVCNLLVVSDEVWGEWKPAYRTTELREATDCARRVIIRALRSEGLVEKDGLS